MASDTNARGNRAAAQALALMSASSPPDCKCPVCLNILIYPVSLSCGHNTCRHCAAQLVWSTMSDFGTVRCPSCRKIIHAASLQRYEVNRAFSDLLQHVFPEQVTAQRMKSAQDRFRETLAESRGAGGEEGLGGENNGAHERGWELIDPKVQFSLYKNIKRVEHETCNGERKVVRDAHDFVMYLGLGVCVSPDPVPTALTASDGKTDIKWHIRVAALSMEEDEYSETGFPALIDVSDEEHVAIVRHTFTGKLSAELVRVRHETGENDSEDGDSSVLWSKTLTFVNGYCSITLPIPSPAGVAGTSLELRLTELESTASYTLSLPCHAARKGRLNTSCVLGKEVKALGKKRMLREKGIEDSDLSASSEPSGDECENDDASTASGDSADEEDDEDEADSFVVSDEEEETEPSSSEEDSASEVLDSDESEEVSVKESPPRKKRKIVLVVNDTSDEDSD